MFERNRRNWFITLILIILLVGALRVMYYFGDFMTTSVGYRPQPITISQIDNNQ